ncbi:MAG TPA: CFI-box-CTERM domain-containing protein [Silvibacterium sp.]|nr:CFI-box-CTERM domain-containing protein [Silvibacterium sp.]
MATIKVVPNFSPSTSGFHFANSFPSVPLLTINVLGQSIPIGDASNGLCGGMVYAVRDFFESGISIWPDTTPPSSGTLFDYIVNRLFDSFDLVLPPPPPPPPFITPTPPFGPGPATYMWLMDPALPDHETTASNALLAPHGRAWVMITEEWPKIQADIDNGTLSPIGLIELKSTDPTMMGKNHQVLAYGYKLNGTDLDIHVYDPNHPDDNTVKLSLSIADPQHTTAVTYSTGETILCFFRTLYSFVSPPPPPPPPKTGCFIATAVYGTDAIEVSTLRAFRDRNLLTNWGGRAFVAFYETVSPPLAAMITRSRMLRRMAQSLVVIPAYRIAKNKLERDR